MAAETNIPASKPRHAPTLYAIIACKVFKGVVALALALFIFKLAGQDLSDALGRLLHWFHLDPEGRFFSEVGNKLDTITPASVRWAGIVLALYGLISLVESAGLIFRFPWACWLAIG